MQHLEGTNQSVQASDLLLPFRRYKVRVILTVACVLALGLGYWVTTPPKFVARISLLALFRSDYGLRPDVGEAVTNGSSFDVDQIMATESRLLSRSELHRAVITQLGIENIYPALLLPRSGIRAVLHGAKDRALEYLARIGITIPNPPPPAPIDVATAIFDSQLGIIAIKSSHVIDLTFAHADPQIAADVLNTLVKRFLDQHGELYNDEQAPIVEARLKDLQQQLSTADQALAHYKAANNLGAFTTRRDLLLQQQSGLETTLHLGESNVREQRARMQDLTEQLKSVPENLVTQRDVDIEQRTQPQRLSMDTVAAKLALARTSYAPDSPIILQLESQLEQRRKEIATVTHNGQASTTRTAQNPLWLTLHTDLLKATDELQASLAKLGAGQVSLALIESQLRTINQYEEHLAGLERDRQVAEDNYRTTAKTYEDRRLIDIVDARRKAAVRVTDLAIPPTINATPSRVILIVVVMLAGFMGILVAFVSNLGRRYYLTPQEIERDLGLAVLISIPDREPKLQNLRLLPG